MRALVFLVSLLAASNSLAGEGVYCLQSRLKTGFLSDTETYPTVCSASEKWLVTSSSPASYCIRNNFTRSYLGAQAGKPLADCGPEARWELLMQDDGSYCLKHVAGGKFLSSNDAGFGTDCEAAEKWALIPVLP
jgi:hypothetical protein